MSYLNEQLKEGTLLDERYRILRCLGIGGFAITYEAVHTRIGKKVAIKELFYKKYLHRDIRISDNVLLTNEDHSIEFEESKKRFLKEARILSDFSNLPGIVNISDFFEANNTAYMVMDYVEGKTIKEQLLENGSMLFDELFYKLLPIMKSLSKIHESGIIHKDISPDNIIIRKNGEFCLLDFGAADNFSESTEANQPSIYFKNGYTPAEQYDKSGKLGPWTDIYALSATIYTCITGITPQNSLQRTLHNELKTPASLGIHIRKDVEAVLMNGLKISSFDRYQSMDELIKAFSESMPKSVSDNKKSLLPVFILSGVVSLFILFIFTYLQSHKEEIKFRGKETEHILLSASQNMTASEFYNTADQIRERIKVFAGENNYIWNEKRDEIEIIIPLDIFGRYDVNSIIQYYIVSPWRTSKWVKAATEEEAKEKNSITGFVKVSGNETWLYMKDEPIIDSEAYPIDMVKDAFPGDKYAISKSKKWVSGVDGRDYGSDPDTLWDYIQVSSNELQKENSYITYYKDVRSDNKMIWDSNGCDLFYPDYMCLNRFTGKQNDKYYILLPGHSENLNKLAMYNLTHPPLQTTLQYSYSLPQINWESIGNNVFDGSFQKNEKDIDNAVLFCMEYNPLSGIKRPSVDDKDKSSLIAFLQKEAQIKEQLDYLEAPYAFGYSPDYYCFYVKTEKKNWKTKYRLLTNDFSSRLSIYIDNECFNRVEPINGIYPLSIHVDQKKKLIYDANIDPQQYQNGTMTEQLYRTSEELINNHDDNRIALYSGNASGTPLAWCNITEPIHNGIITFDHFPSEIEDQNDIDYYLNFIVHVQEKNEFWWAYNKILYVREYDTNDVLSYDELSLPIP